MSTVVLFKAFLVVLLSSFMILTAVSFIQFRVKKRESDYQRIIKILGIESEDAQFATRAVSEEYAYRDYYLPVFFATLTSMFGFIALLFGQELVSMNAGKPNLVLTGVIINGDPDSIQQLRWQNMLVLSMACMGAFVWSTQNIIRRLIAGDLAPSTYFNAAIRIIFAAFLSLMLSFLLESAPTKHYTREILPIVAFLTGMLPEQALMFMRERISVFSVDRSTQAYDFPLQMIEGINMFHRMRLSEVGIDNGQNLAEANIIELLLKTPFNPSQLIDWIAQAKLYIYFRSDIEVLRRVGIRTVFDLRQICSDKQYIEQLANEANISNVYLNIVCQRVQDDQSVIRLHGFENKLNYMISPERDSGVVKNSQ
ncbi:hypothetical protein [Nitrosomonas sp.]|uniref:hypothetical protein n=1 Tax=Nitrosomonas sp. TaxID=42353 RepID=UPI0025DB0026|nr:hypothetical protein [Nitrosomonas sp.]